MLTCNEKDYLKYSLKSILPFVEKLLVYDISNDGSKEYLKSFDKVLLFNEEEHPELISLGEKRQFLLEQGRKLNATHYIVIDADEIISNELERHIYELLLLLEPGQTCSVPWYHVINDDFDCVRGTHATQCILFCDKLDLSYINTTGGDIGNRNHTHEYRSPCKFGDEKLLDKIIVDRYPLLHFGRDDLDYLEWKNVRSMIGEYIDGFKIEQINFRYINHDKVTIKYIPVSINLKLIPGFIDFNIFYIRRGPNLIKQSIKNYIKSYNIPNNVLYNFDMFKNYEILYFFMTNIDNFDKNKVRWIHNGIINEKYHYYRLLLFALCRYITDERFGVIHHVFDFIKYNALGKIFKV